MQSYVICDINDHVCLVLQYLAARVGVCLFHGCY